MRFSTSTYLSLVLGLILFLAIGATGQTKPTPKTIAGGVLNGKALSLPKPVYPDDARNSRMSASIQVQVLIDESGKVISAHAIKGLEYPSLFAAAEAAARLATFSPTLLSGKPVKVSGVITYNFVAERGYEEKVKVLGVSMLLSIANSFAQDMSQFREIFQSEDIFSETATEMPEFPELRELKSLNTLPSDRKIQLLDKVSSSIQAKLDPSEKWQFEMGKNVGNVFSPWMALNVSSDIALSILDEPAMRLNLKKIGDLTHSAPADFPKDLLLKFKEIAAFSERRDLTDDDVKAFWDKVSSLIQTISPD